jgi:hypothetical protein
MDLSRLPLGRWSGSITRDYALNVFRPLFTGEGSRYMIEDLPYRDEIEPLDNHLLRSFVYHFCPRPVAIPFPQKPGLVA